MCFGATPTKEDQVNKDINRDLKQEHRAAPTIITFLLLGTGESGKSTLLKQFRFMHAQAYSEAEVEAFKHQIRVNILHAIITLCKGVDLSGLSGSPLLADVQQFASLTGYQTELTPALALKVESLWNNRIIRDVYNRRSKLQVQSNAGLLLDSVTRIADPNYAPTQQDIFWSKVRTVGVVELQFVIGSAKFKVLDLGGQRAERKKWHMFFQGISALIYVAALDDFDLRLREDEKANRMEDSMALFAQICNMKTFEDTTIILFLNKKDLFKEKLENTDLATFFPDYPGGDYEFACSFVRNKYVEKLQSQKKLYTHFTCATSTNNIRKVFEDVRASILQANLAATGFGYV